MTIAEALEAVKRLEEKSSELERENSELRGEAQSSKEQAGRLERRVEQLQEQIETLLKRLYSRRSERFIDPNQRDLFEELLKLEVRDEPKEELEEREKIEYERKRPKKRGPKPLPDHLPRERVEIDPPEEERICGCCQKPMERVGEVITEELEIEPAKFKVRQYVRGKWRCPAHMNRDVVEELPPRPIEKGRPSPGLLAYIVTSKYSDHQPLYRQERIFLRHGVHIARSTMNSWLGALSGLLLAIVAAMKRELLAESFLQSDDTRIQALDPKLKGKSKRCYIWAYSRPDGEIVYQLTESHSAKGPLEFLEGFSGDLQTDGFSAYKPLWRSGRVRHIGCLAHIRRKFFEARGSAPVEVDEILGKIREAYRIEEKARRELSGEALLEVRRTLVEPVLDETETLISELKKKVLPKSKLGLAVEYAENEWPGLRRYLDVAEARIDNNSCENAMRPVVLGRKNFLFCGNVESGGERAEVFFSLAQSCRRLGVDPFEYLKDVISRISTHPASRIGELTPRGWKEARESEKVLEGSAR
jgi:transposase